MPKRLTALRTPPHLMLLGLIALLGGCTNLLPETATPAPVASCSVNLGLPLTLDDVERSLVDGTPLGDQIDEVNARFLCACRRDALSPEDITEICGG